MGFNMSNRDKCDWCGKTYDTSMKLFSSYCSKKCKSEASGTTRETPTNESSVAEEVGGGCIAVIIVISFSLVLGLIIGSLFLGYFSLKRSWQRGFIYSLFLSLFSIYVFQQGPQFSLIWYIACTANIIGLLFSIYGLALLKNHSIKNKTTIGDFFSYIMAIVYSVFEFIIGSVFIIIALIVIAVVLLIVGVIFSNLTGIGL